MIPPTRDFTFDSSTAPHISIISSRSEMTAPESRSAQKRASAEIQKLGNRLITCPLDMLERMSLPQEILDAVLTAKRTRTREGFRRQRKLVGKLLRTIDVDPIRQQLLDIQHAHQNQTETFHELELFRDKLLSKDPRILDVIVQRYPECDRTRLHQLVQKAIFERENGKGPRAGRLLFRYLSSLEKESPLRKEDKQKRKD